VGNKDGRVERFEILLVDRDSLTNTLGGAHADSYRVTGVVKRDS